MPALPTLYVREGCHLCEDAGVLLDEMHGTDGWDPIDIATDDDLLVRYAHRIPVLVVDGREVADLTITRPDVEDALGRR